MTEECLLLYHGDERTLPRCQYSSRVDQTALLRTSQTENMNRFLLTLCMAVRSCYVQPTPQTVVALQEQLYSVKSLDRCKTCRCGVTARLGSGVVTRWSGTRVRSCLSAGCAGRARPFRPTLPNTSGPTRASGPFRVSTAATRRPRNGTSSHTCTPFIATVPSSCLLGLSRGIAELVSPGQLFCCFFTKHHQ